MTNRPTDWIGLALSGGRYLITAKLGEGGMGVVYRAQDRNLDSDVVIKVPRRAMLDDPEFAHRFAREIRSLVRLSHPGIVKVTDVGECDGRPFAVMQYLTGGSLEDRQAITADGRRVALEPRTVPGWLTGVASALDFIHSQGYVHRDVKPGNILFDAQGHAYLSDFGVAKTLASSAEVKAARTAATGAGLVLGTPEYMAPELIMGEPFDGRIDQYALAATVFEVLCGRLPFEGSSPTAVMVLQTTRPAPSLTGLRPTISERLSEAVLKGLAKDPSGRHRDCSTFAAAVAAAVEAGPAAAEPGGEPVRVRCPSCAKTLTLPAPVFTELIRPGRRACCPRCHATFTLSEAGVRPLDSPPSERGTTPAGTRKLSSLAPPAPSPPTPLPQGSPAARTTPRTQVLTASPGRPSEPAEPAKVEVRGPSKPVFSAERLRVAAGAAVILLIVVAASLYWKFGPGEGTVRIQLPGLANGAEVRLDQLRYEVEDLQVPLRLSRGIHRIRVSKPGLVPYERSFEVYRGTNPALAVQLTRVANRPPPRDAAPVPPPLAHAAKEGSTPDRASKKTPRPRTRAPLPAPPPAPPVVVAEPGREAPGPVRVAEDQQAALLARVVEDPPAGVEPAKAKQTLEEILEAPEEFADRVIIPSGLYRLERYPSFRDDGLIDLSVIQSGLKVQADGSLAPVSGGKMTDLVVAPRLGGRLIGRGVIVRTNGLARRRTNWSDNLAMLTVRVMKNDAAPGEGEWVLGLVKAEFLVDLDFLRIGKGLFKQAFKTVAIASGEEVVGLGNGEEWAERVGLHFTNSIKAIYRRLKNQQSAATWGQFNSQMAKMLNQ